MKQGASTMEGKSRVEESTERSRVELKNVLDALI
jgi:hypothetical protein